MLHILYYYIQSIKKPDSQPVSHSLYFCSFIKNTINMKNYTLIIVLLTLVSCGSYNSINSFYNAHKNDTNVTAIRVPQYMLSLIRNASPEMNSFMGNVKDIRFIQLSPENDSQRNQLSREIGNLTTDNFIEVFRKNEEDIRTLISVREKKDVVKEIIISKNGLKNNSVFYLNGNFNPERVREYVKTDKFDKLSNSVLQQFNLTPDTDLKFE